MFVCAGRGEEFEFAQSIGVGLIESAISLTQICRVNSPKSLVFVGSAGSYDFSLPLLDLYLSEEAFQIESSFVFSKSYTPIAMHEKISSCVSCETIEKIRFSPLSQAIVNSSNYITIDPLMAQEMRIKGILLENMEFFSVMSVARRFEIPAIGIFCVSNYCSPSAHEEFLKNRKEAIERLDAFIRDQIIAP